MKPLNLFLTLVLLTGHVLAEPHLQDFAYSYTITTPGTGAMYQLPLPETVYAKVVQPDLSDIAVFNASLETVPYAFRRAIQPKPVTPAPVTLPLFPLSANQTRLPRELTLELLSDFHGTVIKLHNRNTGSPHHVTGYLVDTSKLQSAIKTLEIDWQQNEESFMTQVSIDTSDDLNNWRELVSSTTLARLSYAGNALTQNSIDLPRKQGKYLKIHWSAGNKGASIQSVRARFFAGTGTSVWRHTVYPGKRIDSKQGAGFNVEVPAYLPIQQVHVKLRQENSLLQGAIYSRSNEKKPWKLQHRGLYYQLQFPTAKLDSPTINIPLTTDRFWRIEYDQDRSSLGTDVPALEFGWQPDQLIFLARGKAPFTLAYGSARIKTRQAPVSQLLGTMQQSFDTLPIIQASLGTYMPGNSDRLLPQPPPLPWQSWLLWACLIIAVLVLALLAWRLYRQMNTD